jgi:hypothetical protein
MNRFFFQLIILTLFATFSICAFAKVPDCTNPDAWPAGMAFTHLKNAGIVDNDVVDFKKTQVKRLASEKIGENLFRQVHFVCFFKRSGEQIQVITVNEVSSEECSMSGVDVYLVSEKIGDYSAQLITVLRKN